MIIDVDTHNCAIEVYEDFEIQNLYHSIKNTLDPQCDLDKKWIQMYDQVRAPDWPDPGSREEFYKLPLFIRQELKNNHRFELLYISDDFETIHLDDMQNFYPSLRCQAKSGPAFCKTDKQVIIPDTSRFILDYSHSRELSVKAMKHYNQKMLQVCKQNTCFDFVLWLAMQDIDACLVELHKYLDEDFFAVVIDDTLPWAMIPSAFPIFEFCAKHKIPIYFHPNISLCQLLDGLTWNFNDPTYVKLKTNWPFPPSKRYPVNNWKINIVTLITENIFKRLPDLRVIFAEKGLSWIPHVQEYMLSQGWEDPLPYYQKHFWFTADYEEPDFLQNADRLGWDRLLFATDYPHNDPGGINRFKDVDLLQSFLSDHSITQTQYAQLTHQNYFTLKNRKSS